MYVYVKWTSIWNVYVYVKWCTSMWSDVRLREMMYVYVKSDVRLCEMM